ncbi:MAG: O-antigen ligase family protein, partial [Bacteroidota bacterium]
VLNCYLVYRETYWLLFFPVFLVILYLYFYSLDKILLLITALTPVAINITQFEFNVGISIPSEPLMLGVLLLFIIKLFYNNQVDKRIWTHPVTIVIGLQMMWMLITSITSDMPLVSFKHLLARLWFVIPFYILGIHLFRKRSNINLFIWFYTIPLIGVIAYTTYNHSLWGFDEQAGHWVMEPFFNDHTAYGAILTLFIPPLCGFAFCRAYSRTYRLVSFFTLAILLIALVLSFSRAAWMSLAFAIIVYFAILLKIKFKWIVLVIGVTASLFFLFQNEIWDRLEKNKQGSSANFVEHLQSISNSSTDDSNLDRINRWQSAFRMFADRPFFGFGPGTYQFEYAPYQNSSEKTLISTNFGDKGNAHSEYIQPLAESGVLGLLCMIALVVALITTGLKVYKKAESKEIKMLSLSLLIGLVTYFVHGTMNDFLDSDKASVPFWGFAAIIVALDLYYLKKDPQKEGVE